MVANENNDFVVGRKKLEEEYEESLWRLMMFSYAEEKGKEYLEELEEIKDDPQYEPSPELNKRIYGEIDKFFRKQKLQRLLSASRKILNKVAMVFLVFSVVFALAYTSVGALRVQVLKLLLEFEKEYTSVKLSEDGGGLVSSLENSYEPSYIPEGYTLDKVTDLGESKIIEYINDNEQRIIFQESNSSSITGIDTENADVKKAIKINGKDGLFVQKGKKTNVTWAHDNRVFIITSELNEDEVVKIAESINK